MHFESSPHLCEAQHLRIGKLRWMFRSLTHMPPSLAQTATLQVVLVYNFTFLTLEQPFAHRR